METSENTTKPDMKMWEVHGMPTVSEEQEEDEIIEKDDHNANPTYLPSTSDEEQNQGGVPDEELIREKVNDSEETEVLNDEVRKEIMVKKIGNAWKRYTDHKTKKKSSKKIDEGTAIEIATHIAKGTWPLAMEQLQDFKQEKNNKYSKNVNHGTPRGQNANEEYTTKAIRGEKSEQERTMKTITLTQEPEESPNENYNEEPDKNKYHWSCGSWQGSFTTTIQRKSDAEEPLYYGTRPSNTMQEETKEDNTNICLTSTDQENEKNETIQLLTPTKNQATNESHIVESPKVEIQIKSIEEKWKNPRIIWNCTCHRQKKQ